MINVAECKMFIRMLEKQILDIQESCLHTLYRADPVEGGMLKCTCDHCQYLWYLDGLGGS